MYRQWNLGIELAKRGWQVTGVEIVKKALERAQNRIDNSDVAMKLIHGDVTNLQNTEIGSSYRLILDTGTFHDLDNKQRRDMARGISDVTSEDATVLLLVWPKRKRPFIRGEHVNTI